MEEMEVCNLDLFKIFDLRPKWQEGGKTQIQERPQEEQAEGTAYPKALSGNYKKVLMVREDCGR